MPQKKTAPLRKSATKRQPKRQSQKNKTRRRNLFLALGAFFVVVVASVVIAVFAAAPRHTMDRYAYNLSEFKAKGYGRTNIANLAGSASTSLDTGEACRKAWEAQSKMNVSYNYFCWRDSDEANGWKPQGITGSGSAQTGADGGNNSILLVSWYSEGRPPLAAPSQTESGANSAARFSVVNMKTKKYRHVELVKPCTKSANKMCKVNSHAGGIAWAGQYLYVASTTGLYVFNVNDIYVADGKPVLPSSEWFGLNYSDKNGEMSARVSSVSFDSSANQLVTSEYRDQTSKLATRIARWNLNGNHHLGTASRVTAASTFTLNASSIQGIASYKGTYIANSSSETVPGRSGRGGTLLKWRGSSSLSRYRMPYHMESAYVDTANKRVWGMTEPGQHSPKSFVFSYASGVVF